MWFKNGLKTFWFPARSFVSYLSAFLLRSFIHTDGVTPSDLAKTLEK